MSAVLNPNVGLPTGVARSEGVWHAAWRRFKGDRVGMVSLAIVAAFVLLMLLAALGLVAGDWQTERGVPNAPPTFMGPAAKTATVGRAAGGTAGWCRRALRVDRSRGLTGEGEAIRAAARSSSLIAPAATLAVRSNRGDVSPTPATRASRADAVARSSPVCPRNGLTATVASSGKAGGIARAAASAACRICAAKDGAI